MTTSAVISVACLGIGTLGYILGRLHARAIHHDAMGYLVPPAVRVEEWTGEFPAAPVFDQETAPITQRWEYGLSRQAEETLALVLAEERESGAA